MAQGTDDHYSGWRRRIEQPIDDEARRVLWRAYQHGSLSEEEFAITLDRLEYFGPLAEPTCPTCKEQHTPTMV